MSAGQQHRNQNRPHSRQHRHHDPPPPARIGAPLQLGQRKRHVVNFAHATMRGIGTQGKFAIQAAGSSGFLGRRAPGRRPQEPQGNERGSRQPAGEQQRSPGAIAVQDEAEHQRRRPLQDPRERSQEPGPEPVSRGPEQCVRQRAAGDRQQPVAPRRATARNGIAATGPSSTRHSAPGGMQHRGEPRRKHWRGVPQQAELHQPCRHLGRPTSDAANTAAAGARPSAWSRRGRWAASAVDTNQVAPNTPASTIMVHGTHARLTCRRGRRRSGLRARHQQPVGGQPEHQMQQSPAEARAAPAERMDQRRAQRPATVLANPANSVMPVIARRASAP